MKKSLLFSVFCLISFIGFCQTNYDNGFQDGYKQGYCYGQGVGCVPPVPPVSPVPRANEDDYNYQQGYNRGFIAGQLNRIDNGGVTGPNQAVAPPISMDNVVYTNNGSQQKREEHYNQTRELGASVYKWVNDFQKYLISQPNNDAKTRSLINELNIQLEYLTSLAKKLTVNNWNEIREDIISEKDDVEQEVNDYNEEHNKK